MKPFTETLACASGAHCDACEVLGGPGRDKCTKPKPSPAIDLLAHAQAQDREAGSATRRCCGQ